MLIILLLSISAQSQDISTRAEVFNYDVGDIFHKRLFIEAYQYEEEVIHNIQIIEKYYLSEETVVYVKDVCQRQKVNEEPIEYEYRTDTAIISDLSSLIRNGDITQVYSDPDRYNGRTINEYSFFPEPYTLWEHEWVDGCGMAYEYYNDEVGGFRYTWDLVYYKKGEEEWGVPNIIGVEEEENSLKSVIFYPNPFTTSSTIEYALDGNSKIQISIYNTIGEMVFQVEKQNVPPGTHTISWSPGHLPQGMYYGVLRSEDGVSVLKMIKQ